MADEYAKPSYKRNLGIPEKYTFGKLASRAGIELEVQYKSTL